MKIIIKLNQTFIVRAVFLMIFLLAGNVFSQALVRINRLWGEVVENGGNQGITYNASNINLFADYNAFGSRFQGTEGFFSGFVIIATDNWNGNTAVFSPIEKDQPDGNVVKPLENYTRYVNPTYTITSGGKVTTPPGNDLGGAVVDPTKCIGTSDQTITVTNKYSCGVSVERKILAWGQNLDNNYSIIDLTFTNDTNITFTNFYVFLHNGEYPFYRADGNSPSISAADQYANSPSRKWYHYYGERTTDSLRVYYYYSSDDPENTGDRIGQPLTAQGGRLLDYDYTFVATLHASGQPYTPSGTTVNNADANDQDDMNQPSVTTVANMQNVLNLPLFSNNYQPIGTDASNYYTVINGTNQTLGGDEITGPDIRPGHHRQNADEQGKNAPGGEPGISPFSNSFESMITCYGPYTFAPGQQIRIVTATGIAGISRDKGIEVGEAWYNDTRNGTNTLTDAPNLPNATTGYFPGNFVFPDGATETDMKKDRWVSTGIDSVHLTVSKAKWNFQHNYNAPTTPPPPSSLSVTGTGEGISLEWSDPAAEAMINFKGYRVMKKIGADDTTYYHEVFRSDTTGNKTTHTFTDPRIRVGAYYYFYVQAMTTVPSTDPDIYPRERGKTLYSNRVYFYNNTEVQGEGLVNKTSDLDKIAIVPNPFNWKDPNLRGYNIQNPTNLEIQFFELPARVTIRIFTESGNLVKTIEHNRDAGNERWNMTNEYGQTVASGIYVVLFQTPDGGTSYQKMVIAR